MNQGSAAHKSPACRLWNRPRAGDLIAVHNRLRRLAALLCLAAPLGAQVPTAEYAQRRAALAARLPDSALLIALGANEPREDYQVFVQTPPFWFLTGYLEPDASLIVSKRGAAIVSTLFVLPRDPASEAWTGPRMGPDTAAAHSGLPARRSGDFRAVLDSALRGMRTLYVLGDLDASTVLSADDQFIESIRRAHPGLLIVNAGAILDSLRSVHSAAELALLRRAIEITMSAQRAAMRTVAPNAAEFQVQATIEEVFRSNGAERPGFATIVGSGPNATSLHHAAGDRVMLAGELVVMDIGASWRGYSADVTRTVPVSGTFTAEQRALYQVVRDAQAAAERKAVLGSSDVAMEDTANVALTAGLARLGLIEGVDAVYDPPHGACRRWIKSANGCSQLTLYYNHGLGHGIGLEVHDPDPWSFAPHTIAPGAAFTIEPGLYVRANALDVLPDTPRNRAMIAKVRAAFERYKDMGVRIEDDYFATAAGVEWVSRAPREITEVEAAMKR